ncbi:MAG: hypothetical protein ACREX8_04640 [Gammaproteobacteria bacterium]
MTTCPTMGAFVRGRLALAGFTSDTDLGTACDVVTAVAMDAPMAALSAWKRQLDHLVLREQVASGAGPDRDTWGLLPEHRAATAPLIGGGR